MVTSSRARHGLKRAALLAALAMGASGSLACQLPSTGMVEDNNNGKGGSRGNPAGGKGGDNSTGMGGAGGMTMPGTGGGGAGPGTNTPTLPGPNDGQLLPAR